MSMENTEVVITGVALMTPIGNTEILFKDNLFAGASGVKSIVGTRLGEDLVEISSSFPIPYAALVDTDNSERFNNESLEHLRRSLRMLAITAEDAVKDLPKHCDIDGLVYGSCEGGTWDIVHKFLFDGMDNEEFEKTTPESGLELVSNKLSELGYREIDDINQIVVNSACASGNQALGETFQKIRSGEWKRALTGAVDCRVTGGNLMNFHMLGALCSDDIAPEKASRPFDKNRSGFVRGEGAAALLIESRAEAEKRGAKIYGKITGYGMTSDAYRVTDGREDALAATKAMEIAIADANIEPADIDLVSAHGTSTPLNDALESKAIKQLFGDHAYSLKVTSLKSQIGHSTVACGVIEAIACCLMMQDQRAAPTINFNQVDPECDLNYVPNDSIDTEINNILSNNFGFGGQNCCVVFSKYE